MTRGATVGLPSRRTSWVGARSTVALRLHHHTRSWPTSHERVRRRSAPCAVTSAPGEDLLLKPWLTILLSRFHVRSEDAFGEAGLPPVVPPHAAVDYDIELVPSPSILHHCHISVTVTSGYRPCRPCGSSQRMLWMWQVGGAIEISFPENDRSNYEGEQSCAGEH